MATSPVAYGARAMRRATPSPSTRAAAPRRFVSRSVGMRSSGLLRGNRLVQCKPPPARLRIAQHGCRPLAQLADHLAAHVNQTAAWQVVEVQAAQDHQVDARIRLVTRLIHDCGQAKRSVEVMIRVELGAL